MTEANESNSEECISLLTDVNLHDDDLTESAKNKFTYHKDALHAFELYRRNIQDCPLIKPVGRHILLSRIDQQYRNLKQVLNYMASHSEILEQKLPEKGPLVICGFPRTGTTLLYNLLACDPNCRAPLHTDMYVDPVPPIPRHDAINHEKRAEKIQNEFNLIDKLLKRRNNVSASHPKFPVEQDQMILQHVAVDSRLIIGCATDNDFEKWFYDTTNKGFAYDYHRNFLLMLNSVDAPSSHWLLKTPIHAMFFETFLHQYPNAQIVMNHRRLDEVLPSGCRLLREIASIYWDENHPEFLTAVRTRVFRHHENIKKGIIKFRTRTPHLCKNVTDVNYDDLIREPIAVVRRIYDQFGYNWSDEFEKAMSVWLQTNPQGKQGRNTYTLAEFGLEKEEIEKRDADYIELFLSGDGAKPNHSHY